MQAGNLDLSYLQAQKAEKLMMAMDHARACILKKSFRGWEKWHATSLNDNSNKMLLALQFMTGQRLGEAGPCQQNRLYRYVPHDAERDKTAAP